MRPMSTIRKWHFEQLRNTLKIVDYILKTVSPDDLITYRDGDDGWTALEIVGHLYDCEKLFVERAKLTVEQDNPMLPFPDQDEEVIAGRYNERDWQALMADWVQMRETYLAYLSTVSEEDWAREGRHPQYAPFSLQDQLFLICWHDIGHIEQLTRVLSQKTQ
jgi:uncharacterized damage-inducible protein DinB